MFNRSTLTSLLTGPLALGLAISAQGCAAYTADNEGEALETGEEAARARFRNVLASGLCPRGYVYTNYKQTRCEVAVAPRYVATATYSCPTIEQYVRTEDGRGNMFCKRLREEPLPRKRCTEGYVYNEGWHVSECVAERMSAPEAPVYDGYWGNAHSGGSTTASPSSSGCPAGYIYSDYTHSSCVLDSGPAATSGGSAGCPAGYVYSDYTHSSCVRDTRPATRAPSGGTCPSGYVYSDYTHSSCVLYP